MSLLQLDREPQVPLTALPAATGDVEKTLRLTVLDPAHNEALRIGAALDSLLAQSQPRDRVLVVADDVRTTRRTSLAHGADVYHRR